MMMMMTVADNWWWIAGLPPESRLLPFHSSLLILTFTILAFFFHSFIPWCYSGGPAWGRYRRARRTVRRGTKGNRWSSHDGVDHNVIPGPRGLPVVGSLCLMRGLAHRNLAAAAAKLGATRLMAFSLGSTRAVVTCNPDVAREILSGPAFVDRPIKESAYRLLFNRAIGFAPYGSYWRNLRRIVATHLFCPRQMVASEQLRLEIAGRMCARISRFGNREFLVRDVLRRGSLDHLMGCVFGRHYGGPEGDSNPEVVELTKMVQDGYDILGILNLSDHLPLLGLLDIQRIRVRSGRLVPQVKRFVEKLIDEHRSMVDGDEKKKKKVASDFVDVLLSLTGEYRLSDSDMVAVLWEMIFRGTDTVSVLIEWILARLVMHPEVQATVHEELDSVVGKERTVCESDLTRLPYLRGVVKEVLRLHPPGPLLSWARLAAQDAVVDGCLVPAGTTAVVNMWAIARDPEIWPDPLSFSPERFMKPGLEQDFSVLGSDLRLAPFGSGRRSCPGKTLGLNTVYIWVASLLHEFVWQHAKPDPIDLSELLRLSCEMASPLTVVVTPRRREEGRQGL